MIRDWQDHGGCYLLYLQSQKGTTMTLLCQHWSISWSNHTDSGDHELPGVKLRKLYSPVCSLSKGLRICADAWFHGSSRPAGEDAVACSATAFFACSASSEVALAAETFGESGKEINCSSTAPETGVALTLSRTDFFGTGLCSAVALAYRAARRVTGPGCRFGTAKVGSSS